MTPILGTISSGISGNLTPSSGYISLGSYVYTTQNNTATTFSNIPNTYSHLEIRYSVGETTNNNNAFLRLTFNGDTSTSSYASSRSRAYAYTVSGGGGSNSATFNTYSNLGYLLAGETTQDNPDGDTRYPLVGQVKIPNYAFTDRRKNISSWFYQQTGPGDYVMGRHWGQWTSTSAITSLSLSLDYSNFIVGSMISLYGIK